jgi:hypothetical protein
MAQIPEDTDTTVTMDSRPPRALLKNLTTGEEYPFLFNPETLEETIEAKYTRKEIVGLGYERLSYKNTTNDVIPIELYLSQLAQDKIAGRAGSEPYIATGHKRWLQSLVYPRSDNDYGYAGPPDVLFLWPRMIALVGRILKVRFRHQAFSNNTLATTRLVASLSFEERLESQRLMEDVMRVGSLVVEGDI